MQKEKHSSDHIEGLKKWHALCERHFKALIARSKAQTAMRQGSEVTHA